MNMKRTILGTVAAFAAGMTLQAAVPEVSGVTMTQANDRLVTITYTLADAPAVITVDVQTNRTGAATGNPADWVSIGGEAVWNAMGDVWRKVGGGLAAGQTVSGTITWHPDHSWPDHKIDGSNARAVVTAWALENTPDYMVVDLTVNNTVRYYPSVDFLPKKGFDQVGAAVTNNPDYKTTQLLMRKIMARGVEWTMGTTEIETGRSANETTHKVTLPNNYYIGVFEVTQKQWESVTAGSSDSFFWTEGDMRPADKVCYNELRLVTTNTSAATAAQIAAYSWPSNPAPTSFLGFLRSRTGIDFDLPSEAQWEFAARAGHGSGYWGDGSQVMNINKDTNLDKLGRYDKNNPSGSATASAYLPDDGGSAIVGSYAPNDWGLYDMHGNVFEWCLDLYEDDIATATDVSGNPYGGRVNIDPAHPTCFLSGAGAPLDAVRVLRSGGLSNNAFFARSGARISSVGSSQWRTFGVRVVCTAGLR